MTANVLTFDPDRHEYRLGSQPLPGVTSILARLTAEEYRGVAPEVMERAATLGKAVHRLIELDLADDLDESSLSGDLADYLEAWRAFRALSGFEPLLSEQQVYSERHGYAGTLDLFGILNGEAALIDAKRTAAVPRTAGPQTAAYERALRECMPEVVQRAVSGAEPGRIRRYALHLMPFKKWALVPFTNPSDERVFLSCLSIQQWSAAA